MYKTVLPTLDLNQNKNVILIFHMAVEYFQKNFPEPQDIFPIGHIDYLNATYVGSRIQSYKVQIRGREGTQNSCRQ